jgi:hypothetical protein
MAFQKIVVPAGEKITLEDGKLHVPDNPIVGFIEGDGTGVDIWAASQPVLDAAVEKAYGGKRKIAWMEVYAGDKANEVYGEPFGCPRRPLTRLTSTLSPSRGRSPRRLAAAFAASTWRCASGSTSTPVVRPVQYFRACPARSSTRADGHGHLPREHGRHLRRHRVGSLHRRAPRSSSTSCRTRWASTRFASRRAAALASSRSAKRALRAWCALPSSTPSTTTARA